MTQQFLMLPFILLIACIVWLVSSRRRAPLGIEALLQRAHPELADALSPFVAPDPARSYRYLDQEELWRTIGGPKGVREMADAASSVATITRQYAIQRPDLAPKLEAVFIATVYLRILCPFCLFEGVLHRNLPSLPRSFAWAYARLFCDIANSLEAAMTMHSGPIPTKI